MEFRSWRRFLLREKGRYLLCFAVLARNAARLSLASLRSFCESALFPLKIHNPQHAQGASLAVRVKFLYRKNHSFVFIYLVKFNPGIA